MSITRNDLKNVLKKYNSNIKTSLNSKVDKITGKGLSTNDYTTTEKNKLAGIAAGANNYVHPTSHSISEISGLQGELDSLKQSASNGKTAIANAITGKGITTSSTATFNQMATNISQIATGVNETFVKQLIGLSIFNCLSRANNSEIIKRIVLSNRYFATYDYYVDEGDESTEDMVNNYGLMVGINADLYKISGTQLAYRDYGDVYLGYYTPGSMVETADVGGGLWYQCNISLDTMDRLIKSGTIQTGDFT